MKSLSKMTMKHRMLLGCFMLVSFITLQLSQLTGVIVHGVINAVFLICVVLHCIVNWKRMWNIGKKKTLRTAIHVLLVILFIAALCSGLILLVNLIAQSSVTGEGVRHYVHGGITRIMLGVVAIHMLINRKQIARYVRKSKMTLRSSS